MVYLSFEQVLLIHDDQIERYGGSHGLRDLSLLESAIMRPQASFGGSDLYESIFLKAGALMQSLIANHPFVDGNKRTGLVSAMVFLESDGLVLVANQPELVEMTLKVATGDVGIGELARWFEKNVNKH